MDEDQSNLIAALRQLNYGTVLRWVQPHVVREIDQDWTPSKRVFCKWVDVTFPDLLEQAPSNWHLTVQNSLDKGFHLGDQDDDEPTTPMWFEVDLDYNCWVDVVWVDDAFEPVLEYVRPYDSTRAEHALAIADQLLELGVDCPPEDLHIATIGGWTEGHISMALERWIYANAGNTHTVGDQEVTQTGPSLTCMYDPDYTDPRLERMNEAYEQAQADGDMYEVAVLDNGMKVMVPGPVFEQLSQMEPEQVKEIMKAMNEGPGSVKRDDSP